MIREHSNDLAVQLPLGSRRQRQLGKDKSVCVCFCVDVVNVSQMWREAHQRGAELVVIAAFMPTSLRDYEGSLQLFKSLAFWSPYLICEINTLMIKCCS